MEILPPSWVFEEAKTTKLQDTKFHYYLEKIKSKLYGSFTYSDRAWYRNGQRVGNYRLTLEPYKAPYDRLHGKVIDITMRIFVNIKPDVAMTQNPNSGERFFGLRRFK